MSYQVLARKSRPQTFEQVVGQQAIVRTLQNGLEQGRAPHALIFSGVRGVGKTTLARIMAKALNCECAPVRSPCNACRSCREISAGASLDLHEIDGASNRGIQEIRELKEKIRFMPSSSRYKIIIIDEVHMLTTEAFNALLKTLEEPPEHVFFMFATTEMHKVPVTILSRCQRYELKRVPRQELAAHFGKLAAQEGVAVEPAAIDLIVREAEGSVRDGLSLLDQVFSYADGRVSAEDVRQVLGLVDQGVIADVAAGLLAGDAELCLRRLDDVYVHGMDLKRFANALLGCFRGLVILKLSKAPEQLLDLAEDEMASLHALAAGHNVLTLTRVFHLLVDGLEKVLFASSMQRMALEMCFLRVVQAGSVAPVAAVLARLDALIGDHDAPLPALSERTPGPSMPGSGPAPPQSAIEQRPAPSPVAVKPPPLEPSVRPAPPPEPPPARPAAPPREDPRPEAVVTREPAGPDAGRDAVPNMAAHRKDVRENWPGFIRYVKERKPWMASNLQNAKSVHCEGGRLVVRYDEAVDCAMLKQRGNVTLLTEFSLDFFQQDLDVCFDAPDDACAIEDGAAEGPHRERQALRNDPAVRRAVEIFNGRVGDIRVGPRFRRRLEKNAAPRDEGEEPESMEE